MIGSLEVIHVLFFTILSVIQICSISSIQLNFNLVKPRLVGIIVDSAFGQIQWIAKNCVRPWI